LDITRAQEQMRHAYFGGAPGLLVSAIVWAIAAAIVASGSFIHGVWALFVGGMLIHPLGMLVARAAGRPGSAKGNPLDRLAFECTITMLAALLPAWLMAMTRQEWFFPTMLLIIGGRYVVFATIYGLRLYWAIGALLIAMGWLAILAHPPVLAPVVAGAVIEAGFALALFIRMRGAGARQSGGIQTH